MKIVFASTPGQEEEISELVKYMYSNVFPTYFTDQEIREFEQLKVLDTTRKHFDDFSTLKDAFQVMVSLQTIISILESAVLKAEQTRLFEKNSKTLQKYGLFFPFNLQRFIEAKNAKKLGRLSVYTKAANEMLI
ncbi:YhcU family protein [Bacillota bacterium Lsc_1132]